MLTEGTSTGQPSACPKHTQTPQKGHTDLKGALKVCGGAGPPTQKRSSFMRMANLWRRSRSRRTGDEDISETQRLTPAS